MAAAVPLLIQVGIAAGTYVVSSYLTPKPKLNPVDKGRFDDIRVTTAEEGGFIPLCFGQRVRLAGNLIWGTVTREYVSHDPGRTGGKGGGGGQQPTPPTNTYSYKKSFAIMVCGTPVRSYRRINENLEIILNGIGSEVYEDFYEAEGHTAAGGAAVVIDPELSGGRGVRLSASGHYVEIQVEAPGEGLYTVSVFYKAALSASVFVSANGGAESGVGLPATGEEPANVTTTVLLDRGANLLKIRRAIGTSDIDRVYVAFTGSPGETPPKVDPEPTLAIDLGTEYSASDQNNPVPYYNSIVGFDADGYFEGHLTAGGQSRFELFAGVETQPQSAIVVAVEGASETPAFRDVSYFAAEDYLLKEGQLGNFTFEIEPDIQDLDETLLYLYTLDGKVTAADCDFSLLAGRPIAGLVIDHRAPLSETVAALEAWFNFDIVPRGGKITAIPRGGAVVTRLYERELRGHLYGEERPRAAVKITHEDLIDLPGGVDVVYLDPSPSKDFHSGNQMAQKIVGFSFDRETLTFPIVGDANTAHAVGQRYLDARHLAAKPADIVGGFGKRHLIPTDIIEVELEDSTLYTYRIAQKQADLQGLVKFGVVPERASVYTQGGAGVSGRGGDVLLVGPPANTLLVVADCVPLRQEDLGGLILYGAACPRGAGSWPGYHLNKRDQNGEVERVGGFDTAATIGVVETASQSAAQFGLEPARSFVVKLYNGSLESRSESEVRAERVNLALYGSGNRWEVIQFLTVTPQAASAPFAAQYLVTGVVSGLYGTEPFSTAHQAGDYFVLFDGAVASFPMRPADITQTFDFIGQTAGQALGDAEVAGVTTFAFQGNTAKPLAVARVILDEETRLAPRDSTGAMLVTVEPRTNVEVIGDEYLIDYLSDDRSQTLHSEIFSEAQVRPAVLNAKVEGSIGKYTGVSGSWGGNTFSLSGVQAAGRAVALQSIAGIGAFVEAELRAVGAAVTLGLIGVGKDWRTDPLDFSITLSGEGVAALDIYEGETLLYTEDPTAYYEGGTRFRIEAAGRRLLFYKGKQSDGSPFLAESAALPNYPLRAVFIIGTGSTGDAQAKDIMLRTVELPTTTLTAAQQQRIYGGLKPDGVEVSIYQHSGNREIGYGFGWAGKI